MHLIIAHLVFFTVDELSVFQGFKNATWIYHRWYRDRFHVGHIAFWCEISVRRFKCSTLCHGCCCQWPRFERRLWYVSLEHSVNFLCANDCFVECSCFVTDQRDALSKIARLRFFSGLNIELIFLYEYAFSLYLLDSFCYGRQVLGRKDSLNGEHRFFCNMILLIGLHHPQCSWSIETFDSIFCVPLRVLWHGWSALSFCLYVRLTFATLASRRSDTSSFSEADFSKAAAVYGLDIIKPNGLKHSPAPVVL